MKFRKPYRILQLIYQRFRQALRVFFVLRTPVWILWGQETSTKDNLTVLYAGGNLTKNYLSNLLFAPPYGETYLGWKWCWKLSRIIKQMGSDCSLVAREVSQPLCPLFQKKNSFYIPLWVRGEIDIPDEKAEIFKNETLKSDLRKIRKNNFSFDVTSELSHLENFYWNMYIPYITKRHGQLGFVMGHEIMEHEFKNCELLLIKKDAGYIAGTLIVYSKQGVRLWSLGIKNGDREHINNGAIGALFYFSYLYLKQKGYKKINLGGSRPFLHDGVLRYKKKWNQKIIYADVRGLLVQPLLNRAGVKGFFLNNPFIFRQKGHLNVALFVESNQLLDDKAFAMILKEYYLPGISKLFIYRYGEGSGATDTTVPAELNENVEIQSAEDLFKPTKKNLNNGNQA